MVAPPFEDVGVIFGQRWFGQSEVVEFFVFELDRGMLLFGGALLVEDIPDVFGAIGFVGDGFSDGADEGDVSVFVFKG
jgi:hypothetical protein